MEKKLKDSNVSGSKFEDLPEKEMNEVQGQSNEDMNGETVTLRNSLPISAAYFVGNVTCIRH